MPDLTLGDYGWHASLCTRVPSTANGDESNDGSATTIHLDPRAKWSDGTPITADDYLFYYAALEDPAVGGAPYPYDTATLTKLDQLTLRYDWHGRDQSGNPAPLAAYLAYLTPPLQVASASGAWLPNSDACTVVTAQNRSACYSAASFQKLLGTPSFHQTPVVPGAYLVQSYVAGDNPVITMGPNRNYFSRFFHAPVLDHLIFRIAASKGALQQGYQHGQYQEVAGFAMEDLAAFAPISTNETYVGQSLTTAGLLFNQRPTATHAAANGGTSIFADANVRRAFAEALDRCTAIQQQWGRDCNDPGIKTNELTAPRDPAYDSSNTVAIPAYDALAASAALDAAGLARDSAGYRTYRGSATEVTINVSAAGTDVADASLLPLIQHDWQTHLNIHVNLVDDPKLTQPWAAGGTLARGTYDVALTTFHADPDADVLLGGFRSDQVPSAARPLARNVSGVNDPQLDNMLVTLRATLDTPTRTQVARGIYTRLTEEVDAYPLSIVPNISLAPQTLVNYYPNPTFAGDEWNSAEWGLNRISPTPTP